MINKISLFFLICFFLGYALLGVFHSAIAFNWTFQDWLINYEGGFVRRGLAGELILILTNIFFQNNLQYYYGINVHLVYFFSISLFCLIYHIFLYRLIKNEELNLEKFFIILSPLSIPFIIYNISAIARKEILLFITILFFIFLLDWLKKKELSIIFLLFTFPLLLLIHEGLIFFIVIFLILYFFHINSLNQKKIILGSIIFLIISLAILSLTIIFKGNTYHVEKICLNLAAYTDKNCTIISAIEMLSNKHTLSHELSELWERVFKDSYLIYYPLVGIVAFLPLLNQSSNYYFDIFTKKKIYKFDFKIIILAIFLNSLPLYIFTHDWGRWLHISYMLSMFSFFYLKQNNKIYLDKKNTAMVKFDFFKINKIILLLILLFYSSVLSVSYFGGYNYWIYNYSMIEKHLMFGIKILKTLPYLF